MKLPNQEVYFRDMRCIIIAVRGGFVSLPSTDGKSQWLTLDSGGRPARVRPRAKYRTT